MIQLSKISMTLLVCATLWVATVANTGQASQRTFLKGIFTARPGTVIELEHNNGEALQVTAPPNGNSALSQTEFSFIIRYVVGSTYSVRIKTAPPGQSCAIYANAEGTIRENVNDLRVGCDSAEAELVSRSSDNKFFGTFYDSTTPAVGGSGADEGRYVAFVSSAVGLGNSKGKFRQIIWRDRKTGETKVI